MSTVPHMEPSVPLVLEQEVTPVLGGEAVCLSVLRFLRADSGLCASCEFSSWTGSGYIRAFRTIEF